MKSKWVILGCYWLTAVCSTYGVFWLGHLATGRPHGLPDFWDHALCSGTGIWVVGHLLFWRKGKGANAKPPSA